MPYASEQLDAASSVGSGCCPFFEQGCTCSASFSSFVIDRRRALNYCSCEDHDLCPLFLSKVLRSSRPRYCGNLSGEFLHK